MTASRPGAAWPRRIPATDRPLRMDAIVNPFGPSIRVLEAVAAAQDLHLPPKHRESLLKRRIAEFEGLPADWLTLATGIDELIVALMLWRREAGPAVLFPPTDEAIEFHAKRIGAGIVRRGRASGFTVEIEPSGCQELGQATVYVQSPNDPTGTLLNAQDAVRLSRQAGIVVIDERHGGYASRSLTPLVREFENVIVLKSFETWAGLSGFPFAYAIAPPRLTGQLSRFRIRPSVAAVSLLAAEATLDDLAFVRASVSRVREEKSRLFRTMRKLNMVQPLPSWANFLLLRAERGDAVMYAHELNERGILVHQPAQPELRDFLRISAVGPDATMELKRNLVEIAASLP